MGVRRIARTRPVTRNLRGLGDAVSQADLQKAADMLAAIGHPATCQNETVGYPGGSYTQAVCSVPGYSAAFGVNEINALSQAQNAAVFTNQVGTSADAAAGWLGEDWGGAAPNTSQTPGTQPATSQAPVTFWNPSGGLANQLPQAKSNATSPTSSAPQQQQQTPATQAQQQPAPAQQQQTQAPAPTPSSGLKSWPWYVWAGAGVAVLLFMRR